MIEQPNEDQEKEAAYLEGRKARASGRGRGRNPYRGTWPRTTTNDRKAAGWDTGWLTEDRNRQTVTPFRRGA